MSCFVLFCSCFQAERQFVVAVKEAQQLFLQQDWIGASMSYTAALRIMPLAHARERVVLFNSRAGCYLKDVYIIYYQ
jgi:hypothetical protein